MAVVTMAANIFHPKCRPRVIQTLPTIPHAMGKQAITTMAGRVLSSNNQGLDRLGGQSLAGRMAAGALDRVPVQGRAHAFRRYTSRDVPTRRAAVRCSRSSAQGPAPTSSSPLTIRRG